MSEVAGWPTGQHEWYADEVASALAGLVVRGVNGNVRPGVITPRTQLVVRRADMNLNVEPMLVVRARGRQAIVGGLDAQTQVAVPAAPLANSRIDVVYALPQDEALGEANGCVFVAEGVPGVAPAKPPIPDEAVELGVLTVPASALSTNDCTLTETFQRTCAAGGVLSFRSAAERDAWGIGVDGQLGLVGETLYRLAGSAWKSVVPPIPTLPRRTAGAVQKKTIAPGAVTNVSVAFPSGTFTAVPNVQATKWGDARDMNVAVDAVTAAGFTLRLESVSGQSRSIGAYWSAEQG